MLRLVPALLSRLSRAQPRAPVRRVRRAGPAAGGEPEQERFVFLEYEPDPAEEAAPRREPQPRPRSQPRRELVPGKERRERRFEAGAAGAARAVGAAGAAGTVGAEDTAGAAGAAGTAGAVDAAGAVGAVDTAGAAGAAGTAGAVGTADPAVAPAGAPSCSGCGAALQSADSGLPGFVPGGRAGGGSVCQRCWALSHHGRALRLRLPPGEHRRVLSAALRRPPRHGRGPLLLYVLDLLELPDPVLPQLPALLGPAVPAAGVLVVGNKVDLLPADGPGHLGRLRRSVWAACAGAGLRGAALVDIRLVSAKTGYGMEGLVSRLQRSWRCAGDVYLLGATNSGKSTLFNTLLRSDYCKSRAPDIVDRATVSPWPGTTLNLLKFPIINPTCDRIFRRQERLKEEATKTEDELSSEEKKYLNHLKKQGYLVGRVGRTFQRQKPSTVVDFDPDALSYSVDEDPVHSPKKCEKKEEFTQNEIKDARWCFDTPGIVKEDCVLNLLTEKEVKLVLPTVAIIPRTFILKPGMTLFLAALGRVDYLQGEKSAWFSVVASNMLPVHITTLSNADAIYEKHAGGELLKVPMGGEERMKEFPPLVPQDITLKGIGTTEAVADIKLSSAGWVAVTAHAEEELLLRAYTPKGTALVVREPPLLPYISTIRGARIAGTAAYRTKKPPSFVENLKTTGSR